MATIHASGRALGRVVEVLVHAFEGPWAGEVRAVSRSLFRRASHGRLVLRVRDQRDPSGWCFYALAKELPLGVGAPLRMMPVDERGRWVTDHARYYRPIERLPDSELPWAAYGAEPPNA
jgi:hypothetical protein